MTVNTFQLLKLKYSFTELINTQILSDRLINSAVAFVSSEESLTTVKN